MAMPTTVEGKNKKHRVMLYALSTCIWCKKTKKLLDNLDVCYDFVFVDLLSGSEEEKVMREVKKYNPECTFPTTVIDAGTAIVGFKEDEIKRALA